MDIPQELRTAIVGLVQDSLRAKLDARGLLLTEASVSTATAETERSGKALLRDLLNQLYPAARPGAATSTIEFGTPEVAQRIERALSFGAVTSRLLARGGEPDVSLDLLCGTFNLGVGLVDGICDSSPVVGRRLLQHIQTADVLAAARGQQTEGGVLAGLPAPLASDPTVAFAGRVIDGFFEQLHSRHPDGQNDQMRRTVGSLMARALKAESQSICGTPAAADTVQLVESSRGTSVLPFQIIEHLSTAGAELPPKTAGTLVGEAMWKIDDLVDLVEDAATGSLNAVLLPTARQRSVDSRRGGLATVLTSGIIPRTAAQAVQSLEAGVSAASGMGTVGGARDAFLLFVQRYAGIADPPGP